MRRCAWLATLAALVVAVAPFLATLHQALVRHAVCEHGDLIELGQNRQSSPQEAGQNEDLLPTGPAPHAAGWAAPWTDSAPAVHAHGHCSVGVLTRSNVAHAAQAGLVDLPVERSGAAPPEHRAVYVTTILPNAPKTSPPA